MKKITFTILLIGMVLSVPLAATDADPESPTTIGFDLYRTPDASGGSLDAAEAPKDVAVDKKWYKRPRIWVAAGIGVAAITGVVWGSLRLARQFNQEEFPDEPEFCKEFLNGTTLYLQQFVNLYSYSEPSIIRKYATWFAYNPLTHLAQKACSLFVDGVPVDDYTDFSFVTMNGHAWSCNPNPDWNQFTCSIP